MNKLGKDLPPGAHHHRAYVGRPDKYDVSSANQFNFLTLLGLRENHSLLDIGCGSLRAGRLFLMYLLPGRYFAIEPEAWLVEDGINNEIGKELVDMKRPHIIHNSAFDPSAFARTFDFILAHSIFTHCSLELIRDCIVRIKGVMNTTSIFAATFFEGKPDDTVKGWIYPASVLHTMEELQDVAAEQGLRCLRMNWVHPTTQTWIVYTHPSNEPNIVPLGSTAEQKVAYLKFQLDNANETLGKTLDDPYVKAALTVKKWLSVRC